MAPINDYMGVAYDVIEIKQGNNITRYRAARDTWPEQYIVMHAPIPPQYWALARLDYHEYKKNTTIKKRLQIFGRFVADLTTLSKCTDGQTSAIIIDEDATQIYSIGINGGPAGGVDCLCKLPTKYNCLHAETNAIAKCKSTDNRKVMICSLSPCVQCASLIINNGFVKVYFLRKWKDTSGLELLEAAGIRWELLEV